MIKTLVFDGDRSMASIGSAEFQTEVFGFPPVPCDSLHELQGFIAPLLVQEKRENKHPLLSHVVGTELVTTFNPKMKEMGLGAIAVDSFSHMAKQSFRLVVTKVQGKPDPDHIDRGVWFTFREFGNRILSGFARMDMPVIVTCHTKTTEGPTGDQVIPGVVTDLRIDIPQYFDVVMYPGKKTVNKEPYFYWHTSGDGRYVNAKIRHPRVRARVPSEIPQDFEALLNIFQEEGKPDPKILILADSGYGKTSSLATINGFTPPTFVKKGA